MSLRKDINKYAKFDGPEYFIDRRGINIRISVTLNRKFQVFAKHDGLSKYHLHSSLFLEGGTYTINDVARLRDALYKHVISMKKMQSIKILRDSIKKANRS